MRAVLITPVLPSATGNGLAMRAGLWLDALTRRYDTDVAVAALFAAHASAEAFTAARAASTTMLRGSVAQAAGVPRTAPTLDGASVASLRELVREADVVVVFRLYLAGLAAGLTSPGVPVVLDIDDLDWVREERLGDLAEARSYRDYAQLVLPSATVVTTASPADGPAVRDVCPDAAWHHVPNGVRPPGDAQDVEGPDIDLLFVGTLGYAPNAIAASWLVDDVLPLLPGVSAAIVGAAPTPAVLSLARDAVTVAGDVPDVTPWYRRSRVSVVPIRAGSGTRTKIPEAWAHQRPVVTTTLGAEGIEASGAALVADDPAAFARACAELLRDPALYSALVQAGDARYRDRHSVEHATVCATDAVEDAISLARQQVPHPKVAAVSTHPSRRPDVTVTPAADGYLARVPGTPSVSWLNRTAYLVMQLCTGANDPAAISRAVAQAFALSSPPHEAVRDTIADLVTAGLVSPGASTRTPQPSIRVDVWAPGTSVSVDVMTQIQGLLADAESSGITASLHIDATRSLRTARNRAASTALQESSASHVLWLDADPRAIAAVRRASVTRLAASPFEVIGVPIPVGDPVWSRARDAATALPELSADQLRAYAQDYSVAFSSTADVSRREQGFVEGAYCSSGAMLVRRTALERMAGSGHVSRHRGSVSSGAMTMDAGWGFFDPLLSQDFMDLDEDYAFCERIRAAGGRVMVDVAGGLGTRLEILDRLRP